MNNSIKKSDGTTGFLPIELEEQIKEAVGGETLEFLLTWAELTKKSLQANKEVLTNCLQTDKETGFILCRFCGEGIPNWRQDSAREHSSECPMNTISDLLNDVKQMHHDLNETINNETIK